MSAHQSRVYKYGLLEPTEGADLVDEQIHAAHRYSNELVRIELDRREAVAAALGEDPDVGRLDRLIAGLVEDLDARRAEIQEERTGVPRRKQAPAGKSEGQGLAKALREARAERREAVKEALKRAEIRDAVKGCDSAARDRHKAVRAEYSAAGSYWGTRALADQAIDQARKGSAPPRFRRWSGEGAVAVQVQGGMSAAELVDCSSTLVQLSLAPQSIPGRAGKARPRLRLRVGSSKGRAPLWAEWPILYHRPLPEDAQIMWAKVVRRRVATKHRWSLHVTVRLPAEWAAEEVDPVGAVAVDLGWSRDATDGLTVGRWESTSGSSGIARLAAGVARGLSYASEIQAARAADLNEIKPQVRPALEKLDLPAEHRERVATLHLWRSPRRFATLALWWHENRIDGDADLYGLLGSWRRRDKTAWEREANTRRRALARRRNEYRVLAADLARRHQVLVIERINLAEIARRPAPESDRYEKRSPQAQSQRTAAAPGELRKALVEAFAARGGEIVEVEAGLTTRQMLDRHREGSGESVDPGTSRTSKWARIKGSDEGGGAA